MGNYLNPDVIKYTEAVDSDIYVDKTGLLEYTNSVLRTSQKYICISRPRRFGKSIFWKIYKSVWHYFLKYAGIFKSDSKCWGNACSD